MDEEDKRSFRKRLSHINKRRHELWAELRSARNEFLDKYPTEKWGHDPDWIEIHHLIDDLFESPIMEEARRETGLFPDRADKARPYKRNPPAGIFLSDRLYLVCRSPLIGRQAKYCSALCRNQARSRKWRAENENQKRLSDLKYLSSIKSDLKKDAKREEKREGGKTVT